MSLVRLTWGDANSGMVQVDGFRVYRSLVPIDPDNMPAHLVELGSGVLSYDDFSAAAETTYYYAVSARKGALEMVSDAPLFTTLPGDALPVDISVADLSSNVIIGPTPGALSITDFSTNIVRRMTYGILIATDFSANAVIGPTPGALSITDFSANIVAT